MKRRSRAWRLPFAAALVLMAGCSVNSKFVYKPGAPAAGGPKLPVKVAVLPFKDSTEDFTKRGSLLNPESLTYNLAKSGIGGGITALTPDLWAKAFADDMAASGDFRSVRFIYSPSELLDEDVILEGTVEKAYAAAAWTRPNEFALGLRAVRRADNRLVWEKEVARTWNIPKSAYDGCGMGIQCQVDRHHAEINRVMQDIFGEARADLLGAIASRSGSGREGEVVPSFTGGATKGGTPAQPPPDSVEATIERILGGK